MNVQSEVDEFLSLDRWAYSEFFDTPRDYPLHAVVEEVERYIEGRQLDRHPFFRMAESSQDALRLWVSQELIMTNAFSQIVLRAASGVRNVHIRSILTEVAFGEHGVYRRGVAKKSHPFLLDQLRESIGLKKEDVRPLGPTMKFLADLFRKSVDPLTAIAAIGVGNERLIIPEYTGIKRCFASCWPEAVCEPFLNANIDEDVAHARLCYLAASILIGEGASESAYRDAAIESIEARWLYFTALCDEI